MKHNFFKNSVIFLAIGLAFFILTKPVFSQTAQTAVDNAITGLETSANNAYGGTLPITDVPTSIGKITGVALSFIGVLFLILLIYGGFTWMVARGNQAEITKAMDLIQAAVIGLVIVLAAYAITAYIGNILTPSN